MFGSEFGFHLNPAIIIQLNFTHSKGHAEIVKILINSGADPMYEAPNGTLPLFIAVKNGN